ncbi:hypothetical protein ASPVEDRAFT_143774 [Aspergillus versicolor CBS 583.65]|uniref:NmrA-like domain-containing protein n=1 Tax=Aspergillus versicolor CBS 583.65 TaxID=1036611 RepID=A0A1L9Q3K3_ASPVE|nr:uncharacterized protein ASPVEDRAFT_143774 [Aspergillus versicolor CBS 583.65]OJJ08340.1 hypothetical protein ASPVEDRAFT_143774 [Aspergillus versicolor CBS 583.65]
MSRIITVVGGTGTQGGSVLKALLAANTTTTTDPKPYTIRTITRNPASPAAKALSSQGIQVLQADLANPTSLKAAFAGSHAIFAVTNFFENLPTLGVNKAMESETEFGINLANAAAQTSTLEHYIWSTLPDSKVNTGGEVVVPYYESKNAVDRYIRSSLPELLEKTTFVWFGWYAGNMMAPVFHPFQIHGVDPSGGETYVTLVSVDPATKLPLLGDEGTNAGSFVRAILENQRVTLRGKTVAAVMEYMAIGDIVEAFGTAKGIRVTAVQISRDDYRKLWPGLGDLMDISHSYLEVMDGKAFTSTDEVVLTREDIGIQGLVGADAAFARLPLLE